MAFFNTQYSSSYVERSETLMQYFDDIKEYELLTPDEEVKLFYQVSKGDMKARDIIIKSNQRFVVSFAKRWATKDNLLDLINEGNIGLINAIDSFVPSKGFRFITYAVWHIRKQINIYLISNDKIVKPVNNDKVYIAANRIKNSFYAEQGRFPTAEEVTQIMADKYNYKLSNVEDVFDIKIISLDDESVDNDGDAMSNESNSEYNSISATCNVEENIEKDFNTVLIEKLLDKLPPKHATIIKMLYGIGELRPLEMEEVAQKVGMTRERIRQLKTQIINDLIITYKNSKMNI